MFIIMGMSQRKGGQFESYDKSGNRYTVFFIGNYFSLFFIPLFAFSKVYILEYGGQKQQITREEYNQIKQSGKIPDTYEGRVQAKEAFNNAYNQQAEPGATYANECCPVCKSKLNETIAYCPHCGQKQPKK